MDFRSLVQARFSILPILIVLILVGCAEAASDDEGTAAENVSETVEMTGAVAGSDATPVPDIQHSEQTPEEAAVQIITAIQDEDWAQVRSLSIDAVSEMQRDESVMFHVQHLRVPTRDDVPSMDEQDDWQVATYDERALVYHSEIAAYRLLLVADSDGWLYDPGPHRLAHASVIELTGDPRDAPVAIDPERGTPIIDVREVDDEELASALTMVLEAGRASIEFDGDVPRLSLPLTLRESASAMIELDDISWQIGEERGPVSLIWTDAVVEEDGHQLVIHGNLDGHVEAQFGFQLEGAPEDGDTVRIEFGTVRVTGIALGSIGVDLSVDEAEISASFEWAFEPAPDLEAIEDSRDQ